MSDGPFMIGANGLIVDVSTNGYGPGYATVGTQPVIATGETPNFGDAPSPGPWRVTQLLPGALVQLRGGGEYDLLSTARSPFLAIGTGTAPQLGSTTGSVQLDITTGAAGTPVNLAWLAPYTNLSTPPEVFVELFLDAQNRPSFEITDVNGNSVAVGAPSGSAVLSGTYLQIRLFWDSRGAVLPSYVAFLINGVAQTVGAVTGPWTGFQPAAVYYGRGAALGGPSFDGQFHKFQAGNYAAPTSSPIQPAVSQTPP